MTLLRLLALIIFSAPYFSLAQNTDHINVLFLYGSKPKKEFKSTENKWFGGKLGGHVGIEIDSNKVFDFVPQGDFHWIEKKDECHSRFAIRTPQEFWSIFGGTTSPVKKTIVIIPITQQQRQKLDSLTGAYSHQTPYDYAFIGMRCGAAAYDVLGQLGIMKSYPHHKTIRKIFYPKRLRKRLLKKAKQNHWQVIREEGSEKRKWEKD